MSSKTYLHSHIFKSRTLIFNVPIKVVRSAQIVKDLDQQIKEVNSLITNPLETKIETLKEEVEKCLTS